MSPKIAAVVSLLTLGMVSCAQGNADPGPLTLAPGVLKACVYPGFAPFTSKTDAGEWVGWDVDYLKQFAASIGLRFQPVEVSQFDGIWNAPGDDICDVAASGISDTADRRTSTGAAGQWSDHYYNVLRAFLVRASDRGQLDTIEDLRDKTVMWDPLESTCRHASLSIL